MTANDMRDELLILADRTMAAGAPSIKDLEASTLLTKAQWMFVKKTISPLMNPKGEGIEESEIRAQGLSNLIQAVSLTPVANAAENYPNGQFVDLPTNFYHSLSEEAIISKLDCDDEPYRVSVDFITHNEYNQLIGNPYRKPFARGGEGAVWRLVYGRATDGNDPDPLNNNEQNWTAKRHELIPSKDFTITSYYLRYLKLPPEIVVNLTTPGSQKHCVLDESTHTAIVEIAVQLMKDATDRPSVQTVPQVQNLE